MALKLKNPAGQALGKMAALVSDTAAEVIDYGEIRIMEVFYSLPNEELQVSFAVGGVDSKGTFHPNPKLQVGRMVWSKKANPEFWERQKLDKVKKLDLDALLSTIAAEPTVKASFKAVLGLDPHARFEVDGVTDPDTRIPALPPAPVLPEAKSDIIE